MIKFASFQILSARQARTGHGLMKDAHRHEFRYDPKPGFLYVRSRAISSRCNDNFDEFPAEEIKKAYSTFVGKPVFVNHHNADHRRARGVIVDAVLHEDRNHDGSPDTWVEVLMEVDAINFPKLAQAIIAGEIDRTSMGTDVAYSKCSACGNKAVTPLDYCFPPGAQVMMADGTFRAIEDVQEGDVVLTHEGRGRRVTRLMERPYDGEMVRLHRRGYAEPMVVTVGHEIMANLSGGRDESATGTARYASVVEGVNWDWTPAELVNEGNWVQTAWPTEQVGFAIRVDDLADDLIVEDGRAKLRLGLNSTPVTLSSDDEGLAFIIGLYLAEGSMESQRTAAGTPQTISWSLGAHEDDLVHRLQIALDKIGAGTLKVYRRERVGSIQARLSNAPLATLLESLVGTGARDKRLDGRLMLAPHDFQRRMLDAYYEGDGWEDPRGHVEVRTASEHLSRQLVVLGARVDRSIPTWFRNTNNSGGPTNRGARFDIHHVSLGRHGAMKGRRHLDNGFAASIIVGAEVDGYVGSVYNIEVEDDHSYVVDGVVVHNCSHIRNSKGKTIRRRTASGEMKDELIREICYGLRFFENSLLVEDPADPTAFFLGVESGDDLVASGRKTASLKGVGASYQNDGRCEDCGVDVYAIHEYDYMLTDQVWNRLGLMSGFVCIGCAEKRLGRMLRRSDFDPGVINNWGKTPGGATIFVRHSDRLQDRLDKTASRTAAIERPSPDEDDDEIEDYTSVPKESKVLVSDGVEAVVEHPDGSMSVVAARSAFVTAMTGNLWRTSTGMVHRTPTCRHIDGEKITPVATADTTEGQVVAAYGARACTTCFPSAPSRRTARRWIKMAMAPIKANPSIEEIVAWYDAQAQAAEPRITRLIQDLASHNGGRTEGLQFRFKKPTKIQEKIERKGFTDGDPREWIDDALRYTMVFHPADYSAQVQDVLYGLQEAGFGIFDESNSWYRGDPYSDLKYVFVAPSGLHFELQFHTEESLDLKERTLHRLYEEFRDNSTPLPRRQELFDLMSRYWDDVEIPPGVLNYPEERHYLRPAAMRTAFHLAYERKTKTPEWDEEDEILHPRNRGKFTKGPRVPGQGEQEGQQDAQQPQQGQEAPEAGQEPTEQPVDGQEAQEAPQKRTKGYKPKPKPVPGVDPEVVKNWVPDKSTSGSGETEDDPVRTSSVDDAALALALGLYVELDSADKVSTMLPRLAELINHAKETGQEDFKVNLCNVTVAGTSLFCVENKGIPRVQMPQLKAFGVPEGTKAYNEGIKTDDGEIDIQPMFLQRLKDMGYAAQETTMPASHLKATQNELGADKVAGITDFVLNGGGAEKIGASPIFVSSDNYIVDGHHRWAALTAADYADGTGGEIDMGVWKIDCDIITLLALANEFADEYGIPQQKMGAKRPCTDCGPSLDEMNAHAARKMAQRQTEWPRLLLPGFHG